VQGAPFTHQRLSMLGRMQQGALWFGRSQHHKQNKQPLS